MAGGVQAVADRGHLTVHHAARGHHVSSGLCLRHSQFHVLSVGGVIIDAPTLVEHTAVAVIGEFVEAGVGHQHGVVAEILRQIAQGHVEDAVRSHADGPAGVLVLVARNPEEHQPADTGGHRVGGGPAQRLPAVLDHTGHRRDGLGFVDTVGDEHRQHQMPWLQRCFSDEPTHGRRRAQSPGTLPGKSHA